jgi:hypothetical protein
VNIWTSIVTFVGVLILLAIAGLRRRPGDSDEPYYDGHRFDRDPEADDAETDDVDPTDGDEDDSDVSPVDEIEDGGDEAEEPAGSAGEQRS